MFCNMRSDNWFQSKFTQGHVGKDKVDENIDFINKKNILFQHLKITDL
jgi:hypothetical protein